MASVRILVISCVTLLHVYLTAADVSEDCLRCICHVEGCAKEVGKCKMDKGSVSCGPFQIKEPYWIDCGRLKGDYRACTTEMQCSEQCVRAYMKRYTEECTGGRRPTCEDYARVHNGGPEGCRNSDTITYWNRVEACCGLDCSTSSQQRHASALPSEPLEWRYRKSSILVYMQMMVQSAKAKITDK